MSRELKDHLTDLLDHPGWKWFIARVEREWGAGGERFKSAVYREANTKQEREDKAIHIEAIATAQREIDRVLLLPHEQICTLAEKEQRTDTHPREPIAFALIDHSRRGGL